MSGDSLSQTFNSNGVDIAYLDEGEGFPTLLIHGFGSNHRVNWVATSWVRDLTAAGRQVMAPDNRGHGESGKPHDPAAYGTPVMAEDVRRLLDHLGIEKADVIGYSMGARIAAFLALAHPERVRRLALSGLGEGLVKGVGRPNRSSPRCARLRSTWSPIHADACFGPSPTRREATAKRLRRACPRRVKL